VKTQVSERDPACVRDRQPLLRFASRIRFRAVLVLCALWGGGTVALAAGDAAAGGTKTQACVACHGENGISVAAMWPNLAGQNAPYLVGRLKFYQTTTVEQYPAMYPLSAELGDQDIADLAAHYAGLSINTCEAQTGVTAGDPVAGMQKAAMCAGCHGPAAVKANTAWPSLAGQKDQYLVAQLQAFMDGTRESQVMAPFLAALTEQDLLDLAAHYSGLNAQDHAPCEAGGG